MRVLILIALLLLAACQTASVAPHPPAPNVEMVGRQGEFIAFFRKAFFTDGEKTDDAQVPLFRRSKPIMVSFPEGDRGIKPLVEQYMNDAQALTGIPYKFAPPPPSYVRVGDLVVHVVSIEQLRDATTSATIRQHSDCFARTYHGNSRDSGTLQATEVWIARDRPDEYQHCVSEELSHAFGLTGDGAFGVPSAFSIYSTPADHRLTEWDRAALWLLYHPDLKPGMMWDEAEPIVERIVKETWGRF